jgi:hypothetical protein
MAELVQGFIGALLGFHHLYQMQSQGFDAVEMVAP